MNHEAQINELKTMLAQAMEEIEALKDQKQENKLYRYFIPEYDADGNKVPEEKSQDYLQVLQEASCRDNGGYTMYHGEGGYYPEELMDKPFDPEKIVRENVIIFDTYGTNPMTLARLKRCQKYLYQSSLGIMSSDSYEFIDSNKIGLYTLA